MSTTSYTDNNVVYTYTVPVSGNTGTAFVDRSPNATGVINIQPTFVRNSVTYTVTSIGTSAFFGNVLDNVTIPNTVITINNNAFKNTGISSISIPDSVTAIGESAFANNKIETTNIGNNVVTIGPNAFLANKLTTITIPDKVVTIGESAFQNNALNNVTIIGTEVTTIGISAFQGNNLSELFIPVSVTLIGDSAFRTNKLNKVYFFNIPTIDTNAFANNTLSIIAYYVDTSTTTQINSLPAVFTTKNPMTKVEILKYQIQQGVTVQYLLADNFTLAEMIAADGSADWLLTYYSLQQLVDAGCPVSRLLLGSSVTPLDLFNSGVSIVNLKAAGANTRVMLNQFSLADLITALYTVSELKTASDSTIAPVVTDNNKVTIQKFKLANAVISQMLTAYNTGTPGLNALLAEYTVSELHSANSSITIANFKAASADIPEMLDAYNNGSVGLAALLVEYTVSELHSADSSISIANFKAANVSISTLISVYKIETNGLKALLEVFTVSEIHIADNTISIADFKAADTDIKQMLNVFNTDSTRLTELLNAGYSPEQLKTASDSTVEPVVVTNQKVSLQKFKDVNVSTITLLNLYNTSLDGLIDFIQAGYTVAELKTDSSSSLVTSNSKVTIERLKRASADIKLMLNEYNTDNNGLIDFISAGYNVSELKIASDSTVEPVVISGNKVTVARLKIAQANLSQMLPLYSLSLLIVADYRVKALLDAAVDANRVISLSDLASAGALLWDLMNNYSISSLLQYFRVAQLITASNEKDSNNDFKVTITAKQSLNTKAGTLKDAGADITEMMDSFSLTALVDAGYTVEELKTASPSLTATNFKTAGATAAQMLNSNKFSLTDLIGADYRVADLKTADSNITLANFVSAGAPLSDLMNAYSLYDLIHVQPVGYTVSQLIAASNEKDSNNDFKVTHIANQALDTKAGTLKNASAPIGEMIVAFSLTDLLAADYRVAELKVANSSFTLSNFALAGAFLWDLMNNYTLSELVNYPFSVSQLITASNEKVNGVYKITDIVNQALDTKAGTLKAASAPIGQMIDAFLLTDLLGAGYIVKDLKDGSVNSTTTLTISSFKTANASVAQMINAYSLFDLIHVEPQGYTVEQLINASNEKDSQSNYIVTDIAKQALVHFPQTLKAAGALISQMVGSFSLEVLLSSPVSYTVAELKVVDGVTLASLNSAFVTMGLDVKDRLDKLYNEFSLKELNTIYTVEELANYTKADSNIADLTIADFKAITEPSVSPAQMVAYFTISELYNGGYSVQYIVTNGNNNMKVQDIIYDGSVPLWAVLNYVGPQLGYYNKTSNVYDILSITDLMNVVSDTNSNYKYLKVYDFYIGPNPSYPKPNDVPIYEQGIMDGIIGIRNNQIAEVATLAEMLRIKYFSIQNIIDLGTYSINNNALKNLTVIEFNAAAKLDRVWMYENRLFDFIKQFNLSGLVNDWSVYELNTKGSGGWWFVTLEKLKVANAPAWDMLNNYTLSELVLSPESRNKYTSAELVPASKEKVNNVYKVTVVDNRDITVSKLKTAGAFLYDLMNYFDLADLFLGGYSVAELITASNLRYWTADSKYEYRVTRIEYQKLGQLGTHVSLTQAELNTGAAKLKQANAPIGEMTSSVNLTTLIAVGYGVAELKTANASFTEQNFAEASTPIWDMLNSYKFYNLYDYYTISELRTASESSLVTDEDNKNLTVAKFKNSNPPAPIWKMLNAYLLSQLTPYYTATELIDNTNSRMNGGNIVNEPNANLELADFDRIEELWELMNTAPEKCRYIDFLVIGYTVKELYDELQLKDDNGNYKVTTRDYWQQFANIRDLYYSTVYGERSTHLYYLAQVINTYALRDILRDNYSGWTSYPVADILDAQAQYGSATTVDELGQPIIASNKKVTLSSLVNAIKSFEENTWGSYINDMINYYRYANGTDSIQNALNILFSQSGLKPKDLLTYEYDNSTKVIIFKAAAVGTSITSSDIYEAFSIYHLLSAYTITEINTIRVNLATPLPILTVDEILNLLDDELNVNYPSNQPYYDKIRDDLVNLVKNGTYSLSHVYSNATNYFNLGYYLPGIGSVRYISANYFKDTFTVSQLKNAGANLIDMVYAYYLNEYYVNRGLEPPLETSIVGLTELLSVYTVSEIGPIRTFLDSGNQNDWMIKFALIGFPIRLLKAAGADIKQMLNYFNTLNIYGQTSHPDLQNNTDGLYWLLYFGYTVSELKAASESTTGTIVDNDKKVTIARFHDVSADHKQMLTAYNTDSDGLKALLVKYTVLELKTASESTTGTIVPADKKVSIKKFYDADANVVQMLDVYNTGSVGLKALLVEYTVSELHSASNSPSIANFKAADADYVEMLTAFNTGSVGLAALLVEYTVSQLHSASNSPSIANFEAANASIPQMLTAYNIDTDGLKDLLVTYTVLRLKTASVDASVTVDKKVTIAKFKLAGADVWQMLNNYILSDLVISVSFSDGYTTRVLVTASTDIRVTVIGNKNISLTTIIAAGAPLYDLMNYYTLSQLVAVPYSVSQLITASKLKDLNNVYKVTVTFYQELDSDAGAVTLKGASALIGQMIVAFSLTQLIKADYRVSALKTAKPSYTISDFKTAVAPLWDMLNNYIIENLLNAGYTVANLKLASQDSNTNQYKNLTASNFMSYITVSNYDSLAVDILNNFTLAEVTNISWRVSDLVRYSNLKDENNNYKVTIINNQNLGLNDFKTRSNATNWDILSYYDLTAMVTGGYTVAELKTTIPYNSSLPIPSNKQVTIASLKAAGSVLSDIINNYTVQELFDESSTVGSYTLTQLVETSNLITAVPLVIDSRKVTLARLLALSPVPPLTYLLTYYTTLQLVGGGVAPLSLANVNSNILEEVVAIGFLVKLKTPRLLSSSVTSGVVALNLNQATGSDVTIDKYFVSYSSNNGRTFTPLAVLMNTTVTPNAPQLGNTLYVSGLPTNKFYSFRIMASSGSVKSSISNTLKNVFVG